MRKADGVLIILLMILSVALFIPLLDNAPVSNTATVRVRNEEVLRVDLRKDGNYSVDGTLGPVNIEVKDGAIRVEQENSPHHYCSRQGFVSNSTTPIVCLPNDTVITIDTQNNQEDTVVS